MRAFWARTGLCTIAALFGCAKYHPRPLNPVQLEQQYRAHALDDAGLKAFITENFNGETVAWPPKKLDLRALTLIGYYYSADLNVARGQIALAEAGILTARARVNPSLGVDGGYSKTPESPVAYSILPSFTIETAGKRGYRILQAEKQKEASRLGLLEAGWLLRSRVRVALGNYLLAEARREILQQEVQTRTEIVEMLDKRLAAGAASRPELDVFRVDRITAQGALQAVEGEVAQTRVTLANTVGVPARTFDGVAIDDPSFAVPLPERELALKQVVREGLVHRADVRRTLAEYAAADAALRLEVARQYPDIRLTPSYVFEEGFPRYTLGTVIGSLPIFHRSQGPIAQAEAQRQQVEARFNALQAQAISEMERALVQYHSALTEYQDASTRLVTVQRDREDAARKALVLGEGDRLSVATAVLQTLAARRTRLDTLGRVQTARAALEDAVQQPLGPIAAILEPALLSPLQKGKP